MAPMSADDADDGADASAFAFMEHTAALWDSGGARAEMAATALATLCRNVLERPTELRYRRVPCSGAAFTLRVAEVPGALSVMGKMGFRVVTYPDGNYYVLNHVDANLLNDVRRELEVGLKTLGRWREKKSADAASSASIDGDDVFPESGPSAEPTASPMASPTTAAAFANNDHLRQLAARSVVHRLNAREQRKKQQRVGSTVCAAAVLLIGFALSMSSALNLMGDSDSDD